MVGNSAGWFSALAIGARAGMVTRTSRGHKRNAKARIAWAMVASSTNLRKSLNAKYFNHTAASRPPALLRANPAVNGNFMGHLKRVLLWDNHQVGYPHPMRSLIWRGFLERSRFEGEVIPGWRSFQKEGSGANQPASPFLVFAFLFFW